MQFHVVPRRHWPLDIFRLGRTQVEHSHIEAAVEAHELPILLLATCVVQDGHGMIPVLAHSRRAFLAVKAVNVAIGLALGLLGYLMGW